jgi:hypothetical protein
MRVIFPGLPPRQVVIGDTVPGLRSQIPCSCCPPQPPGYVNTKRGAHLELISVLAGLTSEVTRGFGTVHDISVVFCREGRQ